MTGNASNILSNTEVDRIFKIFIKYANANNIENADIQAQKFIDMISKTDTGVLQIKKLFSEHGDATIKIVTGTSSYFQDNSLVLSSTIMFSDFSEPQNILSAVQLFIHESSHVTNTGSRLGYSGITSIKEGGMSTVTKEFVPKNNAITTTNDGVIDSSDTGYATLGVWQDAKNNGIIFVFETSLRE